MRTPISISSFSNHLLPSGWEWAAMLRALYPTLAWAGLLGRKGRKHPGVPLNYLLENPPGVSAWIFYPAESCFPQSLSWKHRLWTTCFPNSGKTFIFKPGVRIVRPEVGIKLWHFSILFKGKMWWKGARIPEGDGSYKNCSKHIRHEEKNRK